MNAGHLLAKIGFAVLCALALILPGLAAEEMFGDQMLEKLYQRADLIIDATVTEDLGDHGISRPLIFPKLMLGTPILRLTVNHILKGDPGAKGPLLIEGRSAGVNVIPYAPVPLNVPIFIARVRHESASPPEKKESRWIFFLEDRLKREPGAVHKIGDEDVRFRAFDNWFWRMPVSDPLVMRIDLWNRKDNGAARQAFIPLDDISGLKSSDFGFDVRRASRGDSTIITVSLNAAATDAFHHADILNPRSLNRDARPEDLPKLAVTEHDGRRILTITAPSAALDDYVVKIETAPVPGARAGGTTYYDIAGYVIPLSTPTVAP